VTERALYFRQPSADAMVRSILNGSKTQHRQPMALGFPLALSSGPALDWLHPNTEPEKQSYGFWFNDRTAIVSPFGGPGDYLWVRECFAYGGGTNGKPIVYRADWPELKRPCDSGKPYGGGFPDEKWSPSIHMPRDASRITLLVKRVWVKHLQDISKEGAIAEGLSKCTKDDGRLWKYGIPDRDGLPGTDDDGWPWREWQVDPVEASLRLWNSIYAAKGFGFDEKPLVWACEFERTPR